MLRIEGAPHSEKKNWQLHKENAINQLQNIPQENLFYLILWICPKYFPKIVDNLYPSV